MTAYGNGTRAAVLVLWCCAYSKSNQTRILYPY